MACQQKAKSNTNLYLSLSLSLSQVSLYIVKSQKAKDVPGCCGISRQRVLEISFDPAAWQIVQVDWMTTVFLRLRNHSQFFGGFDQVLMTSNLTTEFCFKLPAEEPHLVPLVLGQIPSCLVAEPVAGASHHQPLDLRESHQGMATADHLLKSNCWLQRSSDFSG